MAFCTKCGNQIGDGVAFCPKCGAPQNAASAAPQNAASATPQQSAPQNTAPQGYGMPQQYGTYTEAPKQQSGVQMDEILNKGKEMGSNAVKKVGKEKIIAGVAILVVLVGLFFIVSGFLKGCGGGANSPKGAVKSFLDATCKGDIVAMMECVAPDNMMDAMYEEMGMTKSEFKEYAKMATAFVDKDELPSYRNLKVETRETLKGDDLEEYIEELAYTFDVEPDELKVKEVRVLEVTCDFKETKDAEWDENDSEEIVVYKIGGKWYIDPSEF